MYNIDSYYFTAVFWKGQIAQRFFFDYCTNLVINAAYFCFPSSNYPLVIRSIFQSISSINLVRTVPITNSLSADING